MYLLLQHTTQKLKIGFCDICGQMVCLCRTVAAAAGRGERKCLQAAAALAFLLQQLVENAELTWIDKHRLRQT